MGSERNDHGTQGAIPMNVIPRGDREEIPPTPVPVQERLRRLPEALLLTAGYYAGKAPLLGDLLRRPH